LCNIFDCNFFSFVLASFSLSASLKSPASTVHLCSVSIASSLAHNSCISLSTAGLGMGLSLLLDSMVVKSSFFSTVGSKEFVLGSDTTNWCRPPALRPRSTQDLL
jgi:hypothetical protein